eukprot:1158126-Rhodomonas_salina.1
MSGTTTSAPVKTTLSPGFARSTISWRTITSSERGIEPAGAAQSMDVSSKSVVEKCEIQVHRRQM